MFCRYCGKELAKDSAYCAWCGKEVLENQSNGVNGAPENSAALSQPLITKFAERVKTNAIIWIVIGSIQILLGIFAQWLLLVVGLLNLISGIKDIKYAKIVRQNPQGIVKNIKPLVGPIISLIYNLFLGGIIGVAGSIYYLVAVRGFVMENEQQFAEMERNTPVNS